MQALHGVGGDPQVKFLTDERVRHGIILALEFDVIINVDADLLPLCELVTLRWQRTQHCPVQRLESTASRAG